MERLSDSGMLIRLAQGIYLYPKTYTRLGLGFSTQIPINIVSLQMELQIKLRFEKLHIVNHTSNLIIQK